MSTQTLLLRPDPAKQTLIAVGLSAFAGFFGAATLGYLLQGLGLGVLPFALLGIAATAGLFWCFGKPDLETYIELSPSGLTLSTNVGKQVYAWQNLSRMTLLETQYQDRHGRHQITRHELLARTSEDRARLADPDRATNEDAADLRIPIDSYISYHNYSRRTPEQEAACRSSQEFADTLNAWRDFSLGLETGAVPTPVVIVEGSGPVDSALQSFSQFSR